MFLIMSAAYISQELESEFGALPPSFLPLGNRRLFLHQVKSAPTNKHIYLSVPESFAPEPHDLQWLADHHVTLLYIPDGLSLGASLVSALTLADYTPEQSLSILFGDTLLPNLPTDKNIITIAPVENSYDWAVISNDNSQWLNTVTNREQLNQTHAVCGYFHFSHPQQLLKSLTMAHWDFIESLNFYHQKCGLTAIPVTDWLDFGHLNTYYRSKAKFTTQRAFNQLEINEKWITKSSTKKQKILAEALWFNHIPAQLRIFLPQFLGFQQQADCVSYQLEYLHYTALNELFVFSKLPQLVWQQILDSCFDFINSCQQHPAPENITQGSSLTALFEQKTTQRLTEYCLNHGIDFQQQWHYNDQFSASFEQLLTLSQQHLPKTITHATVLHGDFCFSNILYDFRMGRIKTIDPRGIDLNNELTIYGDTRYDLAKLSHSILGLYDWIIAGYYDVTIQQQQISFTIDTPSHILPIQQLFIALIKEHYQLDENSLYAMQIQLFLSMLPLHADDPQRQQALMANAFRLYQLILDSKS